MPKSLFLFTCCCFMIFHCHADRIYVMNSPGYNTATPNLLAAISANGHTVVENNTTLVLPSGFTSRCVDPVNGYDWLCFFGETDFSPLLTQIQAFIDTGGKVFYQYEVSCCTQSAFGAAVVASGLTGLSITTNANEYIGTSNTADVPGWEAVNISCCATFRGNAYKGMDGLPVANQLIATADINGGNPSIANSTNFGFYFATTDFSSGANKGGIVGIGDVNMWYDGGEPFGSLPVDPLVVDYFFPDANTSCFLFLPGCLENFSHTAAVDLGPNASLCPGDSLTLDATVSGATYDWQDHSAGSTFLVQQPGTYWVTVDLNGCAASDTIVFWECLSGVLEMPNVFSPGQDGLNDYFQPVHLSNLHDAHLSVYNRWGEPVFDGTDIATGWDGKWKGTDCSAGVYFWKLTFTDESGTDDQRHGFVTLVR